MRLGSGEMRTYDGHIASYLDRYHAGQNVHLMIAGEDYGYWLIEKGSHVPYRKEDMQGQLTDEEIKELVGEVKEVTLRYFDQIYM